MQTMSRLLVMTVSNALLNFKAAIMSLSTNPARAEPSHIFDRRAEAMRQYGEYVEFGFARIKGTADGRCEVVFKQSFITVQVNLMVSKGVYLAAALQAVESYRNETA